MTPDASRPARRGPGLAPRLLAAQTLVLVAGAATSWLVASAVAPSIFHDHLDRAGVAHDPAESSHVEAAFADALAIAVGVALVTAVLMALGVTWYFTRRVQRSTTAMALAAGQIAEGNYESRVTSPALGWEFDQLADTINALATRLDSVDVTRRRILADLAHEMRTPLATIEAHLEALEDGVAQLDEQTYSVMHAATHRLQRLAEDVTAVTRAEEAHLDLHPQLTTPNDLVTAAMASAREGFATKGVRLHVRPLPTTTMVRVDPQRMAQVLGNLLENALGHTPPGGDVTLSVVEPGGAWVSIEVRDTGSGIEERHVAHLFERFYRADPARGRTPGGSGIGLTISRALVEAHGGRLSAYSDGPGTGATFTIRLPSA